ncbi:HNH endonuclease [Cupriavidus oxalaticus]
MSRERSRKLVAAKKAAVLQATGRLACEACSFDFKEAYGDMAADMCEVHHVEALCTRASATITTLDELAILCANCHRVIHATKPMWPVSRLAERLRRSKGQPPRSRPSE